jgi:RNA-directed DNA polymerase
MRFGGGSRPVQTGQRELPLFEEGLALGEPVSAPEGDESSVGTEELMEEVASRANLVRAVGRVVSNKGAAGVDGMTVRELRSMMLSEIDRVSGQLLGGAYFPQPVRGVEIPKGSGGVRKLGIPTVWDRVVQQALLQVLQPRWDPTFSEGSFGFRPRRSAHDAISRARHYVAGGKTWVVDLDLEKFFDHVHHDRLMARIAKRVRDRRVLKLIRRFLTAGVLEGGLVSPRTEGTPQGGPLSPLLTNLVLDELDRELEARGHAFVRYADDITIYVGSQAAARRVLFGVRRFLEKRLRLRVNGEKSAVGRPWERDLLGFTLGEDGEASPGVGPAPFGRMKARVRELTGRWRGVSLQQVLEDLRGYLTGWMEYYGWGCPPGRQGKRSSWETVDSWIRRRVRCYQWVQWKTGKRRYAGLRSLGVSAFLSACTAKSSKGPWHMSRTPALSYAMPNAHLHGAGLPSLVALSKT